MDKNTLDELVRSHDVSWSWKLSSVTSFYFLRDYIASRDYESIAHEAENGDSSAVLLIGVCSFFEKIDAIAHDEHRNKYKTVFKSRRDTVFNELLLATNMVIAFSGFTDPTVHSSRTCGYFAENLQAYVWLLRAYILFLIMRKRDDFILDAALQTHLMTENNKLIVPIPDLYIPPVIYQIHN